MSIFINYRLYTPWQKTKKMRLIIAMKTLDASNSTNVYGKVAKFTVKVPPPNFGLKNMF